MHFRALLTASCALLVTHAVPFSTFAQDVAATKPASIAIVELFTSEGCSSCPPADALLRQINLKQTNAGQLIVGISEHVTYWNNLGWRDPYSLPVFTERQSVYASRLSAEGSYTPQMVLNGRDQFVGSNGGALQHALLDDSRRGHLDLSILSSNRTPSGMDVMFSLKQPVAKPLDIIVVLTDDADRSNVLRGENGGRLLQHVAVARSLIRVATVKGDSEQSVHLPLPDGLQVDSNSGHHLILFAQEPHQGAILGAATAPF
jgi:hypothetical protein